MGLCGGGDAARDGRRVADLAELDDEALEIVMVVVELVVVMRLAVLDVVLGADAKPEKRGGIDLAVGDGDDPDRARQRTGDCGDRLRHAGRIEQVALVEHDEIGAGDLVLEHFLDGIVMVERAVGLALASERIEIGSDLALGERSAVDHRHHAVDGDAALDRRPMEGLHQGLGQSEAGGLDDDMLDSGLAREDLIERRDELVGDGAAQAAIGELDDVLLGAGGIAAAFQDLAVDADIAELIDDDGEPPPVGVLEHMADQRRLARAEKAGDDGAGDAR